MVANFKSVGDFRVDKVLIVNVGNNFIADIKNLDGYDDYSKKITSLLKLSLDFNIEVHALLPHQDVTTLPYTSFVHRWYHYNPKTTNLIPNDLFFEMSKWEDQNVLVVGYDPFVNLLSTAGFGIKYLFCADLSYIDDGLNVESHTVNYYHGRIDAFAADQVTTAYYFKRYPLQADIAKRFVYETGYLSFDLVEFINKKNAKAALKDLPDDLKSIGISDKAIQKLSDKSINLLSDLLAKTEKDLFLDLHLGSQTLPAIVSKVKEAGLSFRTEGYSAHDLSSPLMFCKAVMEASDDALNEALSEEEMFAPLLILYITKDMTGFNKVAIHAISKLEQLKFDVAFHWLEHNPNPFVFLTEDDSVQLTDFGQVVCNMLFDEYDGFSSKQLFD